MARVQIERTDYRRRILKGRGIRPVYVAILAAAFLCGGCRKSETLSNAYDYAERMAAFEREETDGRAPAFARDLCVVVGSDDEEPSVTGEAAAVLHLNGGEALYHKNVFNQMNPASTTKVMTALLALKYGNLEDLVTVTDAAVIDEAGSSMAGVKPGDVMSMEDLLYGLMIPSGNDAANAIAVHMAGSVEAFAELMNEEAARLGATGTHFANANGLTDPNHYTTAYDLYLMFHEALKYEKFREIIGAGSHKADYTAADGSSQSLTWNVGNYYMNGKTDTPAGLTVFGGKTGTTQAAGSCLIMGSRTGDGSEYVSVVMKAESRNALYEDMTKIISNIVK